MSSFLNDMSPPAGAQGYDSSDDDGACIGGVSQLRLAARRLHAAAAGPGGLGGASQRDAMKELRCAEMNIWSERLRSIPCLQERRMERGEQPRPYRPAFGCAGAAVSAWGLEAMKSRFETLNIRHSFGFSRGRSSR